MSPQSDLLARDLVYVALGSGRDNAEPIGSLAERLKLTRRQVELAVQALRVDGIPIASGSEGIWIGSAQDMAATAAMLLDRLRSQRVTLEAVQATAERLARHDYEQLAWTLYEPNAA